MPEVTRLDATNTATPLPIPEGAQCRGCGYALQGLTVARCPECGQAFDPAERGTMRLGIELSPLARPWLTPPGWIMNGGFGILSLLTIIAVAPPGVYFMILFLTVFGWMLFGACWALRLLVAAGLTIFCRLPVPRSAAVYRRWAFGPLAALIVIGLVSVNVPERTTHWLSRPAMDRWVRQIQSEPAAAQQRRWIGLYRVHSITLFPGGGGRFLVADADVFDRCGYAYAPDAQPPVIGGDSYDPLGGGWWLWLEDG